MQYTVKAGDSLSSIAARFLGQAYRWNEIYELNKSVVGPDPDKIYPGQVLVIPTAPGNNTGIIGGGQTSTGTVGGILPLLAIGGIALLLLSK